MRSVTLLGATGSIGNSALDVIARHPNRFRVAAVTAHRDAEGLAAVVARSGASAAVIGDDARVSALREALQRRGLGDVTVAGGAAAIEAAAAAADSDTVVAGIVGAAGLRSALAAVRAGKRVLLANKESLVVAGALFMDAVVRYGAELVPVDSEHNALFQCLPRGFARGYLADGGVTRLLLTASGGPFRATPLAELARVTPEQACAHPNWSMGRKISVDSATMMNKGLELIEACWLFGVSPTDIEVVIHPQSIVHSLVAYRDGSVLAQLGNPDMRTPIAHGLGLPERLDAGVAPLDLFEVARLDFERPDPERFACLSLAAAAMESGGTAPAVLNAANEVAVAAFLEGRLGFMDIPRVIEGTLGCCGRSNITDVDDLLAVDERARHVAAECAGQRGR